MSALIQLSSSYVSNVGFGVADWKRFVLGARSRAALSKFIFETGRQSPFAGVVFCCRRSTGSTSFASSSQLVQIRPSSIDNKKSRTNSFRTRGFSTSPSDEGNNSVQDPENKILHESHAKNVKNVPILGSTARRNRTSNALNISKEGSEPLISESKVGERTYDSDLVVVLDMDECLIHSVFQSATEDFEQFRQFEQERSQRRQGDKSYKKWTRSVTSSSIDDSASEALYDDTFDLDKTVEKFQVTLPDGEGVLVHQRPHLASFLAEVCQKFETHIFTAAMPVYASPVLDVLEDRARAAQSEEKKYKSVFSQRWYRDQCTVHRDLGVYVKDLEHVLTSNPPKGLPDKVDRTKLFNEKRIVLIDNNPMSFLANPCNGILVSNFYDDPSDDTLPAVVELLHELDGYDDVRPKLRELFGLSDALNQVLSKKGFTYKGKSKPGKTLSLNRTEKDVCVAQQDHSI